MKQRIVVVEDEEKLRGVVIELQLAKRVMKWRRPPTAEEAMPAGGPRRRWVLN